LVPPELVPPELVPPELVPPVSVLAPPALVEPPVEASVPASAGRTPLIVSLLHANAKEPAAMPPHTTEPKARFVFIAAALLVIADCS
ncbi:MAG TPA: hypothetical protein VF395_13810, partial [Polyangiaceae bacterium]